MSAITKPRPLRTVRAVVAAPVRAAAATAVEFETKRVQQACTELCQAIALVDTVADHSDSLACWAASRLLDVATMSAAKAISSHSAEDLHEAGAILAEALAVLGLQGEERGAAQQLTRSAMGIHQMVAGIKQDLDAVAERMA